MTRYLFILLAAMFSPIAVVAAETETFRVVAWNIQWLPGRFPDAPQDERVAHMKAAQEILEAMNPDVVLLQEVADWKTAAELVSVIDGMQVHVTSDYEERPQNLVVASRFPADSAWYGHWKQNADGMPSRGYAFAALELPSGQLMLTYSLHLKSNRGGVDANAPIRQDATGQLLRHIESMQKLYGSRSKISVLVGGDFNSSSDDPRFRRDRTLGMMKAAGFKWVHEGVPFEERVTIPAGGPYPDNCFDHIFFKDLTLSATEVIDGSAASDHNPVIADFQR